MRPPFVLMQETWGDNVRAARGDRSQTWLARQVGVDQTTISRIERGQYRLSPELMLSLAASLEMELGELFAYPRGYVDLERQRRILARKATAA